MAEDMARFNADDYGGMPIARGEADSPYLLGRLGQIAIVLIGASIAGAHDYISVRVKHTLGIPYEGDPNTGVMRSVTPDNKTIELRHFGGLSPSRRYSHLHTSVTESHGGLKDKVVFSASSSLRADDGPDSPRVKVTNNRSQPLSPWRKWLLARHLSKAANLLIEKEE